MRREQAYAKVVKSVEFADACIELIVLHDDARAAIRFDDWRGGILNRRPLDLREDELLVLLGDAIAFGIFSYRFQHELYGVLEAQAGAGAMLDGELTAIFDQITHEWPVAGWEASRGVGIDTLRQRVTGRLWVRRRQPCAVWGEVP